MIDITGLDKLIRHLEEAEQALFAVNGELATVNFNPQDPESIEAAFREVENLIDARLGSYATNPIVAITAR